MNSPDLSSSLLIIPASINTACCVKYESGREANDPSFVSTFTLIPAFVIDNLYIAPLMDEAILKESNGCLGNRPKLQKTPIPFARPCGIFQTKYQGSVTKMIFWDRVGLSNTSISGSSYHHFLSFSSSIDGSSFSSLLPFSTLMACAAFSLYSNFLISEGFSLESYFSSPSKPFTVQPVNVSSRFISKLPPFLPLSYSNTSFNVFPVDPLVKSLSPPILISFLFVLYKYDKRRKANMSV